MCSSLLQSIVDRERVSVYSGEIAHTATLERSDENDNDADEDAGF